MSRTPSSRPRDLAGPAARRSRRNLPVWDFRTLARRVHLITGALVGLFLVVAGLTGSALVYRPELDGLLHSELLRVEPGPERVSLEAALDAVRAAYPDDAPIRIQMPRAPEETYEVTLSGVDPLQVYVDPYTGTVLGARRESETLSNMLFQLHEALLAGETGHTVMGIVALLSLIVVATGLVVWWPGIRSGVRRVWEACMVRRSPNWRRFTFDLHGAVGIWSTLFIVLTSVTGASLVFHDAFMAGLDWATGSPPRPAAPVLEASDAARLPLDALVERAGTAVPDGQVTYVILPASATAPVTVRKKVSAELHPNGRNFVYLDPRTGEVRAVEDALAAPAGTRAYNVLYPLHIGRWGGWASRAVYALLGLTPLVLFVSGLVMWWNRSLRRRVRLPDRAAVPSDSARASDAA